MRGDIRVKDDKSVSAADIANYNLVLFGDPGSNVMIAKVLGGLPIQWTKSEITVGAQKFPTADHALVLIYPNPLNPQKYVVLNTGQTFSANRDHVWHRIGVLSAPRRLRRADDGRGGRKWPGSSMRAGS